MTSTDNLSKFNASSIVFWFHRFLKEDESTKILFNDVYNLCKGYTKINITSNVFVRLLRKTFPDIKRNTVTVNHKRQLTFEGIALKCIDEIKEEIISISDIPALTCVSDLGFYPISQDESTCKLGYLHNIIVNEVQVLSEVTVTTLPFLGVSLFVLNKHFDSNDLGIRDLTMSANLLAAMFRVLTDLSFCMGYKEHYGSTKSGSKIILKETWEDGTFSGDVYRSFKCKRLLIMSETGNVCKTCSGQARKILARDQIIVRTTPTNKIYSTEELIDKLFPGLEENSNLAVLIQSQVMMRKESNKRNYRWDPRILKLCLMLWGRSPTAYNEFRSSGFLIVPSSRLLRYYKTKILQQHKPEILEETETETDPVHVQQESSIDGLKLDNMSVQEFSNFSNTGKRKGPTNLETAKKLKKVPLDSRDAGKEETRSGGSGSGSDASTIKPGAPCDPNEYNFNYKRRGVFLVINNKVFDASTGQGFREGSDLDAERVEERFQALGFEVRRYDDLTANQMSTLFFQVAAEDHSDADCFGCAILSHGKEGRVFGRDGMVGLDYLVLPFKGDRCSTLVGKPKLFFVQACRGVKMDRGADKVDSAEDDTDSATDIIMRKIPVEADVFMAYSTVPGHYSWRNNQDGSWFVQALCLVLENQGTKLELQHIMTQVNRMVAYDFESCTDEEFSSRCKQMPCMVSMLTRYVYFKPKKNIISS